MIWNTLSLELSWLRMVSFGFVILDPKLYFGLTLGMGTLLFLTLILSSIPSNNILVLLVGTQLIFIR